MKQAWLLPVITILLKILDNHVSHGTENKTSLASIHTTAWTINTEIAENSNFEEYEDDPDDLELQASEHEIESILAHAQGDSMQTESDKAPKKTRKRRRRRRRKKRIRTSTNSYEDELKINDSFEIPSRVDDLPPDPEVLHEVISTPRKRPRKRRRKTTTPTPIEEEYLLNNNDESNTKIIDKSQNKLPENIEEIIVQKMASDQIKLKETIPPAVLLPTRVPTKVEINTRIYGKDGNSANQTKFRDNDTSQENNQYMKSSVKDENKHYVEHEKNNQTKTNIETATINSERKVIKPALQEPLLFVTAPQIIESSLPMQAVTKPSIKSTVRSTESPTETTRAINKSQNFTVSVVTSKPTFEPPRHVNIKDNLTVYVNTSNSDSQINVPHNSSVLQSVYAKRNENLLKNEKKSIRKLPPTNAIFRNRLHPQTVLKSKHEEETLIQQNENEMNELKLYTISPLEIQKLGQAKQVENNEIISNKKSNNILNESTVTQKTIIEKVPKEEIQPTTIVQSTTINTSTEDGLENKDMISNQNEELVTSDELLNIINDSKIESSNSEDGEVKLTLETPQVKDDILIFLKSKAELNKLSKILHSRNMTLSELIDHRERGSSQLHLSDIFKSNSNEPKINIPETDFDSTDTGIKFPDENVLGAFPNFVADQIIPKEEKREPRLIFDTLPQFQAAASETIYTKKKFSPELVYSRAKHFTPNTKIPPFYGSSEELIISYTTSTGKPNPLYGEDDILSVHEHEGSKRIPSELKSIITISSAIIAFAVLGFFVLLISCKVRQKKAQKYTKHGILREHLRNDQLRSSTRSNTPVMQNGYYGYDMNSDTSSTHYYLWKTIRKTFRYE